MTQTCGQQADHVDHILPRSAWPAVDSLGRPIPHALTAKGSTRRWRRIRAWVLARDGWRCQVLVDEAGEVLEAPRPARPPLGPDDPDWLRATCPRHNLQRGAALTDARPTHRRTTPTRWSW